MRSRSAFALVVAVMLGACAQADSGTPVDAAGEDDGDGGGAVDATACDDVWYGDADGDMHGDPAVRMIACTQPAGYVAMGDDCDDTQAFVYPGGVEVCDGLDNDCSATTAEMCPAGCVVRVGAAGSRYLFCAAAATYALATTRCAGEQFMLARVNDQAENSYLQTTVASAIGNVNAWLGGNDGAGEGVWRWADGAQFWMGTSGGTAVGGLYENWDSGEPNNDGDEDCAELRPTGLWNDNKCNVALAYVCERY